jgi:hypothetical protein
MFKKQPEAPRPKTKVRFLTAIAGNREDRYGLLDFSFGPGQVAELDSELASAWIAGKICEPAQ